jgi:predicted ABC-type ATPase
MPNLFIIAGCNGAGKTTASFNILPEILECKEFVNADIIAAGLSPFQPETVAIAAGRLMLQRIENHITDKIDFAFETTLATKSYVNTITKAKQNGYEITLLFFYLNAFELAIERVKKRVASGGHNIPKDVIERRYKSGLQNLFKLYLPLTDNFILCDNSSNELELVVKKIRSKEIEIYNLITWRNIINNYEK